MIPRIKPIEVPLPMTEVLSRLGDVPASFVEAEMEFERKLQETREWLKGRGEQSVMGRAGND